MNRKEFMKQLQELQISHPDIMKLKKDNLYHSQNTVLDANANEGLNPVPHNKTVLICMEELTEFIEELIIHQNNINRKNACDDDNYIGILEELSDTDLSIHSMGAGLDLPESAYEIDKNLVAEYISRQSAENTVNDMVLCCTRTIKHLSKYLRSGEPIKENAQKELAVEVNNLLFLLEAMKTIHCVSEYDMVLAEHIKFKRFIKKKYKKPEFVPDKFKIKDHIVKFNDETALGEPTAWIYLSDQTSIEITHEGYDVKTPFFSIRRHCSDEDFDNDTYHGTCGVISSDVADNMLGVCEMLEEIINDLEKSGITVSEET